MRRITLKDLDHVVDAINTLQDIPLKPWTRVDDKLVPTAWNYHIGGAYGGWRLEQHGASGSGIRDVFQVGYVPKRELHGLLQAYRDGLRAALARATLPGEVGYKGEEPDASILNSPAALRAMREREETL